MFATTRSKKIETKHLYLITRMHPKFDIAQAVKRTY